MFLDVEVSLKQSELLRRSLITVLSRFLSGGYNSTRSRSDLGLCGGSAFFYAVAIRVAAIPTADVAPVEVPSLSCLVPQGRMWQVMLKSC